MVIRAVQGCFCLLCYILPSLGQSISFLVLATRPVLNITLELLQEYCPSG